MFPFGRRQIVLDVGTSRTSLCCVRDGRMHSWPSLVAVRRSALGEKVVAVGDEAKAIRDRAPSGVRVVQPIQKGAIADFGLARLMLKEFFRLSGLGRALAPMNVIGVLPGASSIDTRAFRDLAISAGVKRFVGVPAGLAAALGAQAAVTEPGACAVIDVGGGKSEITLTSMGGVIYSARVKVGGDNFDQAIKHHLFEHYGVVVGDTTAEQLKIELSGEAAPSELRISGRDIASGLPVTRMVAAAGLIACTGPGLEAIARATAPMLDQCPPESIADIAERGVMLCGRASATFGLKGALERAMQTPVHKCAPEAVVEGGLRLFREPRLRRALAFDTPGQA